ncbi:MAG: FAD-dependent oxidoreductase [Acidimicrobiales bacterium]
MSDPSRVPGSLGPAQRLDDLDRLDHEEFDVLMSAVGSPGSVRARRSHPGSRVALVEQRDLASGTSSRSSKLLHGGLRYLEQQDFALGARRCTNRACWRDGLPASRAPRLVPDPAHPPAVAAGVLRRRRPPLRPPRLDGKNPLPRHRHLSQTKALALAPELKRKSSSAGSSTTPRSTTPDTRWRWPEPPPATAPRSSPVSRSRI